MALAARRIYATFRFTLGLLMSCIQVSHNCILIIFYTLNFLQLHRWQQLPTYCINIKKSFIITILFTFRRERHFDVRILAANGHGITATPCSRRLLSVRDNCVRSLALAAFVSVSPVFSEN